MSETSPCDSISIESLTDGVRVGKSSGVWEEVVPYQLGEVTSGGYVYFAVPVEQGADETADVAAYRAFGDVEFRVTFHNGEDQVSRTYRIVPTDSYLTWVKDPKGNTFDGARFEVTRTGGRPWTRIPATPRQASPTPCRRRRSMTPAAR